MKMNSTRDFYGYYKRTPSGMFLVSFAFIQNTKGQRLHFTNLPATLHLSKTFKSSF